MDSAYKIQIMLCFASIIHNFARLCRTRKNWPQGYKNCAAKQNEFFCD